MQQTALPQKQNNTLAALSGPGLSIILAAMGTSAAAVTLPQLSDGFRGDGVDVTLVVSIYVLATTALIIPVGRAGDLFGKRIVLVLGLCTYILGTFLACQAPALPFLVASRFVQGAGAAAMLAMPLALVRDFVPVGQVGRWMGVMGMMSAIGTASGPALGGAVTASWGWRAVYLLQIPLAFVALTLCMIYVLDRKRGDTSGGLNLPAAGALAVSLAAFTFLVSDIASGFDIRAAVLVVGAFFMFLIIESRSNRPIIPINLLRSTHLCLSFVMNAIVSAVMMGMLVVGPFFLIDGLGQTTAQMGLAMSVGPIASALSGMSAGRLTERVGAGRAVLLGALAMTVATAAMAGLPYLFGLIGFILAFIMLAPSYQVFLAALNTAVMEKAAEQDRGVTAGVLNLSRNFGFILGAGTTSTIFWSLAGSENIVGDQAHRISYAMAGTFAACCVLVCGAVFLVLVSQRYEIDPNVRD